VKETVYTISDWYDGARAGVADYQGQPHYYKCQWDESAGNWAEHYGLMPLDADTFHLALEDWAIWQRWQAALEEGKTTQETHPALPEDRPRHDELQALLAQRLQIPAASTLNATAAFDYRANIVEWTKLP